MSVIAAYPKRLIEVDLPISRISAHSRREKSIRHGHISTLHIWWARRPLAACRAVICAALWPDPADPHCPHAFVELAEEQMLAWATLVTENKSHVGTVDPVTYSRLHRFKTDSKFRKNKKELRRALLDFAADFSNWDNATDPKYLATARTLTAGAHQSQGGLADSRPIVIDPFAGGGAIPIEASRVGAEIFASDLNPVATLLNKVAIEYVPTFGKLLPKLVRTWAQVVQDRVFHELEGCYSPADKEHGPVLAYIWARWIQCEGPGCGAKVPLLKSLWLGKKPKSSWALELLPKGSRVTFGIRRGLPVSQDLPGTVKRSSVTCPCCGYTTPAKRVREQLKSRNGGTRDAILVCSVHVSPTIGGRYYRLPTEEDFRVIKICDERWKKIEAARPGAYPMEPTPVGGGKGAGRAFSQRQYGIDVFGDLFLTRQLLALTTFADAISRAGDEIQKDSPKELATAVRVILSLALDKLADYGSSLATWSSPASQETVRNTFSRQALSTSWDFAEAVPFAASSGGWMHNIAYITEFLEHESTAELGRGTVVQTSATHHPLPSDCADLLCTDPPYYDAIPYADLSDFFVVWLRRTLAGTSLAPWFQTAAPKTEECVLDETRGHDKQFFEETMAKALAEARRVVRPNGIGVVVFANKTTEGWEAQLQALISSGWIITGSWPIDTERSGRLRASNSAALASSVHLICRPRESSNHAIQNEVGDWRTVLSELPTRIHEWMPRLSEEGVVGADAIFACLGPALEIYSQYSRVEKANGEAVALREYLEQVWAAVAKEALSLVFKGADTSGFEPSARLTAMWLWTLSSGSASDNGITDADEDEAAEDDEDSGADKSKNAGFILEYDAARKIAQGLGAHLEALSNLVEVKGSTARLLAVAERTRSLFGKSDATTASERRKKKGPQISMGFLADLEEAEVSGGWGDTGTPHKADTVLDRIHQAMILFGAGRGEALRRFLVDDSVGRDERFWRLAQALSALYPGTTDEKRWVDGVLARKKGLGL